MMKNQELTGLSSVEEVSKVLIGDLERTFTTFVAKQAEECRTQYLSATEALLNHLATVIDSKNEPSEEEEKHFNFLLDYLSKKVESSSGFILLAMHKEDLFLKLLELIKHYAQHGKKTPCQLFFKQLNEVEQQSNRNDSFILWSLKPALYIELYKVFSNTHELLQLDFERLLPVHYNEEKDFQNIELLIDLIGKETKTIQVDLIGYLFNALSFGNPSGFSQIIEKAEHVFSKILDLIANWEYEQPGKDAILRDPDFADAIFSTSFGIKRKKATYVEPTDNYAQDAFITSIIKYLLLKDPAIEEAKLEKIKAGLCFGLSVVMAEMHAHHQAKWWIRLYKAITDWGRTSVTSDETAKTLIESMEFLSGIDSELFQNVEGVSDSLSQSREILIERAFSYVGISQCNPAIFRHSAPHISYLTGDEEMHRGDEEIHPEYLSSNNEVEVITCRDCIKLDVDYIYSNITASLLKHYLRGDNRCILTYYSSSSPSLGHANTILFREVNGETEYALYDPDHLSGEPIWFYKLTDVLFLLRESMRRIIPDANPHFFLYISTRDQTNQINFEDFLSTPTGLPLALKLLKHDQEKLHRVLDNVFYKLTNSKLFSEQWAPFLNQEIIADILLVLNKEVKGQILDQEMLHKKQKLFVCFLSLIFNGLPQYFNSNYSKNSNRSMLNVCDALLEKKELSLMLATHCKFDTTQAEAMCTHLDDDFFKFLIFFQGNTPYDSDEERLNKELAVRDLTKEQLTKELNNQYAYFSRFSMGDSERLWREELVYSLPEYLEWVIKYHQLDPELESLYFKLQELASQLIPHEDKLGEIHLTLRRTQMLKLVSNLAVERIESMLENLSEAFQANNQDKKDLFLKKAQTFYDFLCIAVKKAPLLTTSREPVLACLELIISKTHPLSLKNKCELLHKQLLAARPMPANVSTNSAQFFNNQWPQANSSYQPFSKSFPF